MKISNMSSNEQPNIESKRGVYDACDPAFLRELREAAGMDLSVLARMACLSLAQVRALETEMSDHLFYSQAIKRQAYKRLLMILGAEPPTVQVPDELRDAGKVADAHLNTLDQIVAMSHQPPLNRSTLGWVRSGVVKLNAHKQFTGALLLLVVAVGLFVVQGPEGDLDFFAAPASVSETIQAPLKHSFGVAAAPSASSVAATAALAPASADSAMNEPGLSSPSSAASSSPAPTSAAPSSAAQPAALAAASKLQGCAHVTDEMPQVTPLSAQKEGRYVYVMSPTQAEICVVDGNKQATLLQLKPSESRSIYGASPWQVSSPQLSKLQIFFQGWRVAIPEAAMRVNLVEVPVSR
jgi:cytoskeletal protein RodZ